FIYTLSLHDALPISELMFFMIGMLSFRHADDIRRLISGGRGCMLAICVLIVFVGWVIPSTIWSETQPKPMWPYSVILAVPLYLRSEEHTSELQSPDH